MRTREMKYSDYEITREEVKLIRALCRLGNAQICDMLNEIANEVNPGLAGYIVRSLENGLSYSKLLDVPAQEKDFRAYKLKCIAKMRNAIRDA